ncbi:MAG: hypothetical protein ACP5GP_04065 [Thermogladius sp.]
MSPAMVLEVITLTLVMVAYVLFTSFSYEKIKNRAIYVAYPSTLLYLALVVVSARRGEVAYPALVGLAVVVAYWLTGKLARGLASLLLTPLLLYLALILALRGLP